MLYALKALKSLIRGKLVKLFTGDRNAAVISNKGSTSLQRQALEIFQFCVFNYVTLQI